MRIGIQADTSRPSASRFKAWTFGLGMALLFAHANAAHAEEDCKDAWQNGYGAGKDIKALQSEVSELREVLGQLLELDQQRTALLSQALGGQAVSRTLPSSTRSARATKVSRKTAPSRSRSKTGRVSGSVSIPGGGKTAYVYVQNVRGRLVRGRTLQIKQINKQFRPQHLVVQKGTRVDFPNLDPTYHNVFSRSQPANFDLGIYRAGDAVKGHSFNVPGLVRIHCNMHEKMQASVLVVPNHLYTETGADGTFTLDNVPRGKRKIVAWAPGAKLETRWVTVGSGTANLDFTLKKEKRRRHKNKHGQAYRSYE